MKRSTTRPPLAPLATERGGVLQRRCACGRHAAGACAACRSEAGAAPLVGPVLQASGEPLAPAIRSEFEPRFGHDFSGVRVHADARGSATAVRLGADAFTVGRAIAFAPGRYAPGTPAGRRLLAHELAHVVQQRAATPAGPLHLLEDPALEAAADRAAAVVTAGATVGPIDLAPRRGAAVQRQPANPPTASYVEPDPQRHNVCFVMGTRGAYQLADWYARAYYGGYAIVHADSFCGLLDELDHRLQFTVADEAKKDRLGHVVIISHADAQGRFYFPMQGKDDKKYVSPQDVQEFLSDGWLQANALLCRWAARRVAAASDAQTRVTIKGCNFGQNQAAVDAMRGLFGGQATVTAPTKRVELRNPGYGPAESGRRTPAEVIGWMVRNGYLPPRAAQWSAEEKTAFVLSLFPGNTAIQGIPADYLVLDEKTRVLPSDPRYHQNIAESKP